MNEEIILSQDNNLENNRFELVSKIITFLSLIASFCYAVIVWVVEPNLVEILIILILCIIFLIYFKILKHAATKLNPRRSSVLRILYALGTSDILFVLNFLPFNFYSITFTIILESVIALLMVLLTFVGLPEQRNASKRIMIIFSIIGFVIIIPSAIIGMKLPEYRFFFVILCILTICIIFSIFAHFYVPWGDLDDNTRNRMIRFLSLTIIVLIFVFLIIILTL